MERNHTSRRSTWNIFFQKWYLVRSLHPSLSSIAGYPFVGATLRLFYYENEMYHMYLSSLFVSSLSLSDSETRHLSVMPLRKRSNTTPKLSKWMPVIMSFSPTEGAYNYAILAGSDGQIDDRILTLFYAHNSQYIVLHMLVCNSGQRQLQMPRIVSNWILHSWRDIID